MSVWIVTSEHWEDWAIEGVYASLDAALADHPAGRDQTWEETAEGGRYLKGAGIGTSWLITQYDVER